MRISTNTFYELGAGKIGDLQSMLLRTQQQIAAGKRILSPSDDPVAAAAALDVTQSQATNTQLASNRDAAKSSLNQEEGVLQSVTTLVQNMKTLTISAGNGGMSTADRKSLASQLSGQLDQLMGLANTQDSSGNYIFSGYQTNVPPFSTGSLGVQYNGDQGQRLMQVSTSQQMALGDTGDAIFQSNNKTGNGTFVTAPVPANIGSGIISSGAVSNNTLLTGHSYNLAFSVSGSTTTYSVVDSTTSTTLSSGNAYTSGQLIGFDGLQFDVSGAPSDGDQFTVAPSTSQSLFATVSNLINVLNTASTTPAGQAFIVNGLNSANDNLSNALDNVLTVRSSVGSRLQQLDSLDSDGQDRDLQLSQTLSSLQDLDYTKAITQLTQQNVTLQAAQQSFVKIQGLSLFDYLK
jgi:flagellar hook-associated protein 3 FlgL